MFAGSNFNFLKALGPIRGTSCVVFGATESRISPDYWTIGVVELTTPAYLNLIHAYTLNDGIRMHRGNSASIVQLESSPWRVNFFSAGDWVGSYTWFMYSDLLGGGDIDLCETSGKLMEA